MESWRTSFASRTHFEVLGLGLEGQVLGLEASSPRKYPVLGSRTALFFEQLKFCWKMPETSRKICKYLFCFLLLQHRRSQRVGASPPPPPNSNFTHDKKCDKKVYCFFSFFLAFFAYNSNYQQY